MSILLGLFETSDPTERPVEDEDLLVFGYACKLYRDDTKALMENSGQLLIPWMGDTSLMVDRWVIGRALIRMALPPLCTYMPTGALIVWFILKRGVLWSEVCKIHSCECNGLSFPQGQTHMSEVSLIPGPHTHLMGRIQE